MHGNTYTFYDKGTNWTGSQREELEETEIETVVLLTMFIVLLMAGKNGTILVLNA